MEAEFLTQENVDKLCTIKRRAAKFVGKVDRGDARSVETYRECKQTVEDVDALLVVLEQEECQLLKCPHYGKPHAHPKRRTRGSL